MITLGRQTINSADAELVARKVTEALVSKGGKVDELGVYPTPRGLVFTANIHGHEVAVIAYCYNVIDYNDLADALMREYHAGLNPVFAEDADMAGLHRPN